MSKPPQLNPLMRLLRRVMGAVIYVETDVPAVALTFDDGPHPVFTPQLLDLFDEYQAKATFFVLGENARRYPAIIQRMVEAEHTIGNHTFDHPALPLLSRRARWAQLRAWAQAVAPYGSRLFRPPYGNLTFAANVDVWLLGYRVVTWNVVGQDWLTDGVDALLDRMQAGMRPGSIILLHDALHDAEESTAFDRTPTVQAVAHILQEYHTTFRFVTVPELMRHGRPILRNWVRPADIGWLGKMHTEDGQSRAYR